jgi:hypothetical protein
MIEINTRNYERVHGCKPKGYGLWYFQLPGGVYLAYPGSYRAAHRAAVTDARRVGGRAAVTISLCP